MSLRINLNTAALTAHRLLSGSDSNLSKSIERLSSGYKINSAADDPAGLVISEKLRAQVSGLEKAISNAGDAVNMVKTAEGALVEVQRLVRSMRDLAVHAANSGANDDAAVKADQAQITNAIQSINKIADETQFGNKKLLDGSAGIKVTVTGSGVTGANLNNTTSLLANDDISISMTQLAQQATLSTKAFGATDAATIGGAVGNKTFQLSGNGKTVDISYTDTMTVTQLKDAINAKSTETGIVASTNNTGVIVLKSQEYGSNQSISITGGTEVTSTGDASVADIGVDAHAAVTHNVGTANVSDADWVSGNGTVLEDSLGNKIYLTTAAASTALGSIGTQFDTTKGSLVFQVGAYAGQTREINIQSCYASGLGQGAVTGLDLSNIDVTSPQGAQDAIRVLDQAITDISNLRANLGATQTNVLESSVNSLTIAKENISASESTIRDTDMAAEVVNMTKAQILQQAGVSMLAQANQTPQTLLKLLQ
ncbi:MAG: flagellin [Armatimonadota bacterium]|nr:flagellin [bacterium]